ncbi:unnamed protein product [Anisakis simplex]|uniref:40S ribosomal protein S21 n=1 Tax=Anisakis simplex TaxID=6269 RepID=A0A0M3K3T8_ANISI|nr:unnamed protein product [Anisakis simplex]
MFIELCVGVTDPENVAFHENILILVCSRTAACGKVPVEEGTTEVSRHMGTFRGIIALLAKKFAILFEFE